MLFHKRLSSFKVESVTLPKTNSSPLNLMVSNRNLLFHWSIFRCYVSGRVNQCMPEAFFQNFHPKYIRHESFIIFILHHLHPSKWEEDVLLFGTWLTGGETAARQRWVGYTMNFEEMFVPLVSRICLWNSFGSRDVPAHRSLIAVSSPKKHTVLKWHSWCMSGS